MNAVVQFSKPKMVDILLGVSLIPLVSVILICGYLNLAILVICPGKRPMDFVDF